MIGRTILHYRISEKLGGRRHAWMMTTIELPPGMRPSYDVTLRS